jgi:hypothetical protein
LIVQDIDIVILLVISVVGTSAHAQSASWKQMVGIQLAGNPVGSDTGAITAGFLPWTTIDGIARVNLQKGEIHFFVHDPVFAAGASGKTIGYSGSNYCGERNPGV